MPAFADAPVSAGWWTTADPGGGALPVGPGGPDVPAGGLLVASDGSASAPLAVAALAYAAAPAPGSSATMTLQVAPNSATTPKSTLELCPLTVDGFQPANGGPMADAPKYDCSRNVTAGISADGKAFSFDLSQVLTGGPVAFAIVPGAAVERVVLSKPDAGSLTVAAPATSGFSDGQLPPGAGTPDPGVPAPSSGSPVPVADPVAASSAAPPATGAAAVGAPPAAGSATAPQAAAAMSPAIASGAPSSGGVTPTTAAPAAGGASGGPVSLGATTIKPAGSVAPLVAILAVVGLVLAGLLWGYAGSAARRQVSAEAG